VKPKFDLQSLEKAAVWEYVVRFLFGGLVTMCCGLVAHHSGPSIGGLFLAFPAILPASLTLITRHGNRAQAVDDARGACLGTIGLAAFAAFAWRTATTWPAPLVLGVATLVWIAVSMAAWALSCGREDEQMGPTRSAVARS
jgi:Protein of unknown function (DUF3147)